MRRIIYLILSVTLMLTLFVSVAFAEECPDGTVIYRQSFADVTLYTTAGVVKGSRSSDTFELSVSENSLDVSPYGDEKAYVLLPFYNTIEDYTAEVTFSFNEIVKENGYFSLMLTSRGEEPDNIESITVRANGECDDWGTAEGDILSDLVSGEKITLRVSVKSGVPTTVSLKSDGSTFKIESKNIVDVVEGRIGFVVRNLSVNIYDVAVIKGTDYEEISGSLSSSSLWTDENPYTDKSEKNRVSLCGADSVYSAPATGDSNFIWSAVLIAASLGAIFFLSKNFKKRR